MKARNLLLIMACTHAALAGASKLAVSQAFDAIIKSDFITGRAIYSNTAKQPNEKSGDLQVYDFCIPVGHKTLIDDAKTALLEKDEAYFKSENTPKNSQVYRIEISDKYSTIVGGNKKNVITASYEDVNDSSYRYVYAIDWLTRNDTIEGRLVQAFSKKPSKEQVRKTELRPLSLSGDIYDSGRLNKLISTYTNGSQLQTLRPEVYANSNGELAIANVQGASLYASTGKYCRVEGSNYNIKALKNGNAEINGEKYDMQNGATYTVLANGTVKRIDNPSVFSDYSAVVTVDKSLKRISLNGTQLFAYAEGFEYHNINGRKFVKAKTLRNGKFPTSSYEWLMNFDVYCNKMHKYITNTYMLTAYAERLCNLSKDCSMLNNFEKKVVKEETDKLLNEINAQNSDQSTYLQTLLHTISQNIGSGK